MLGSLDPNGGSLYMQIYSDIRRDILFGRLTEGQKLPSKRALAERLRVSLITVENAYEQLIAEGYIRAVERSGYYVQFSGMPITPPEDEPQIAHDDRSDTDDVIPAGNGLFPFNVWARLMRSVIMEKGEALLQPCPGTGAYELREEIARYLYRARGISVSPKQIIIGAGTEYLYNMLIQLLGRERSYAVEDPCYTKLSRIYSVNDVNWLPISLDEQGMSCAELSASNVTVAHISPAHHFPTGIVMPISRRREIMQWAESAEDRYIIEDDYDSEFRWSGKPVPSMFGMDTSGRVIYVNTFSMTIAPSVRIGYMCLPEELCGLWEEKLSFCSCPVPVFEQYTLARFISGGYFERHINRMKKHYRRIRELVLELFGRFDCVITEEKAGLHFLAEVHSGTEDIAHSCERCGVRFTPISEYSIAPADNRVYVVNYFNAVPEALEAERRL
ncbi:MAG: PLP-dependent aminotransferase family protein [Oscillospiraceae bacterium]|nr:PLP-dependent aminotransferase family protein [Oscillospiraceae bacterium]